MVGALRTDDIEYEFIENPSPSEIPATANVFGILVLEDISTPFIGAGDWETVREGIDVFGFRYGMVPFWYSETPWTIQGGEQNPSTLVKNIIRLSRPEIKPSPHGLSKLYIVSSTGRGQLYDTFNLMMRTFELDVNVEKSLLDMLSHEPEFLPVVTDMVEAFAEDLRKWDGGAELLLRAFTDPDASGKETLQFVVHYSDEIPWDEMIKKWDEVADRLDGIIPTRDLRLRVGITFQSF